MALRKWGKIAKRHGLRVTVRPMPKTRNEPQTFGVFLVVPRKGH